MTNSPAALRCVSQSVSIGPSVTLVRDVAALTSYFSIFLTFCFLLGILFWLLRMVGPITVGLGLQAMAWVRYLHCYFWHVLHENVRKTVKTVFVTLGVARLPGFWLAEALIFVVTQRVCQNVSRCVSSPCSSVDNLCTNVSFECAVSYRFRPNLCFKIWLIW